jgi:hypothetical protein
VFDFVGPLLGDQLELDQVAAPERRQILLAFGLPGFWVIFTSKA